MSDIVTHFKKGSEPRVFAYRNLHRDCFSLRDTKTGRVTYRETCVLMKDVTFSVGKSGRLKVIKEKRKNVHAGVRGHVIRMGDRAIDIDKSQWEEITYNPYFLDSFVLKSDSTPISRAALVLLVDNRIFLLRKE